jgi:hypothetical protein
MIGPTRKLEFASRTQPQPSLKETVFITFPKIGSNIYRRTISIRGEFRGLVQQAVSVGAPAPNMHPHPRRCASGNNPICWADSDRACS